MFDSTGVGHERRVALHQLLDEVLDGPTVHHSEGLASSLTAWQRLSDAIDGQLLTVLPAWEASAGWARDGNRSMSVWLANQLGLHRATARSLRRTALEVAALPHVAAAAAAGVLSLAHLRQLAQARQPEVEAIFDRDEAELVAQAQQLGADALAVFLAHWRQAALAELGRNEPDPPPGPDTEDTTLQVVRSFQGRGLLTMDLTPEDLAALREAIDARIEHWRRTGQLTEDDRPYAALAGAALMAVIADGSTSTRRAEPRPLLIAVATLSALFDRAGIGAGERDRWRAEILGGGPIGRQALRSLMERANLQLVVTDDDGEPLHVGRAKRLATAAMLAALLARSGGRCEFPGCHASHHRCHAHHIAWWEESGSTDIDNLVLLCPGHHGLVHKRGFGVARGPTGLVWSRPDGSTIHAPPFSAAA